MTGLAFQIVCVVVSSCIFGRACAMPIVNRRDRLLLAALGILSLIALSATIANAAQVAL